jgi:hypothetical protein
MYGHQHEIVYTGKLGVVDVKQSVSGAGALHVTEVEVNDAYSLWRHTYPFLCFYERVASFLQKTNNCCCFSVCPVNMTVQICL